MLNARHVEPEGQQNSAGIWLHGWKFEALQVAALGKRPITCAPSSAVNASAVAEGAEKIRQTVVILRKINLPILIRFWLGLRWNLKWITSGNSGIWRDAEEYKVGERKKSIESTS